MNLEGQEINEESGQVEKNIGGEKKENLSKEKKHEMVRNLEKREKVVVEAIQSVIKDLRILYADKPNGEGFRNSTVDHIDDLEKKMKEFILELEGIKQALKDIKTVEY